MANFYEHNETFVLEILKEKYNLKFVDKNYDILLNGFFRSHFIKAKS